MAVSVDIHPPVPVALPVGPQEPVETEYWEGLKAGELRMQHCAPCDQWVWSPSWICPRCHSFDLEWKVLEPVGTVYSWTRTDHAFPASREFADALPYFVAMVELPHAGGRRLMGIVTGADELRIGTLVRGWIQSGSDLTGGWSVLRWAIEVGGEGNG